MPISGLASTGRGAMRSAPRPGRAPLMPAPARSHRLSRTDRAGFAPPSRHAPRCRRSRVSGRHLRQLSQNGSGAVRLRDAAPNKVAGRVQRGAQGGENADSRPDGDGGLRHALIYAEQRHRAERFGGIDSGTRICASRHIVVCDSAPSRMAPRSRLSSSMLKACQPGRCCFAGQSNSGISPETV